MVTFSKRLIKTEKIAKRLDQPSFGSAYLKTSKFINILLEVPLFIPKLFYIKTKKYLFTFL